MALAALRIGRRRHFAHRYEELAGAAAPVGMFDDFARWIHASSFHRLKVAAVLAIAINVPLMLAFDMPGFRAGWVESEPGFLALVYWRIAFISLSAVFLAAALLVWSKDGAADGVAFRTASRAYILALALLGAIQSGYAHIQVDDVSVYGLILCAIAALLHTPDRFRWVVFALALATLAATAALRKPPDILYAMMINAVPVTVVAFAIEVIIYRQLEDIFIKSRIVDAEREKSERLLRNILPEAVATRLQASDAMIADGFPEASILFADLVGFTELSGKSSPQELVDLLNDVFGRFDDLADRHGVEKIKTIGDAYMVACGLPSEDANHVGATADFALALLDELERVNGERGLRLQLRIGMHAGYVVAGVIGHSKFSYDVWGNNVNLASRMESTGLPGRIQVTEIVQRRLRDRYHFEERGMIEVKGCGSQRTYFLMGRRSG